MRIDRRTALFGVLAVLLAALFVRLGFWQVDRLSEKRSLNALRSERAAGAEVRIPPFPDSSAGLPWRRVELRGHYDFSHEIVLRGRLRDGRPGVELLTPLRTGDGSAVLVHRGWLPAPDGLHAPLDSARSGRAAGAVVVRGLIMPGADGESRRDPDDRRAGTFRARIGGEEHLVLTRLDVTRAAEALPYPVFRFYVRATEPTGASAVFRPLPPPAFDEGPHLAYAIQWFAFALISLVGAGIYLIRDA